MIRTFRHVTLMLSCDKRNMLCASYLLLNTMHDATSSCESVYMSPGKTAVCEKEAMPLP